MLIVIPRYRQPPTGSSNTGPWDGGVRAPGIHGRPFPFPAPPRAGGDHSARGTSPATLDESTSCLLAEASAVNPWSCLLVVLGVLSLETLMFIGTVLPGEIALLLPVGVLGVHWSVPLFYTAVLANLIG